MGLAVGVWTTVARRPARVATELVGGKAMVHDWTTDVRKSVPRAMRPRSMASSSILGVRFEGGMAPSSPAGM